MVFPYKNPLMALALGLLLGVLVLVICLSSFEEDGLQLATRTTGRLSALLFLVVFVARPLVGLFGAQRFGFLLRQRGGLGLILAGNHYVHLVLLSIYVVSEGVGLSAIFLNPGLLIYAMLVAMTVTSFGFAREVISIKTINLIHLVGLYALAAGFFETLVLSVILGHEGGAFRVFYSLLFVLAFVLRFFAFQKSRSIDQNSNPARQN